MKQTDNISKELQEVAPILSGIEKVNCYHVNEGYFQNSAENIMAMLAEEELPSVLSQIPKQQIFSAPPASYFVSLGDSLISQINSEEVEEELSYSAPHLLALPKFNIAVAPDLYFSTFPEVMTQMAAHEDIAHHSRIEQLGSRWRSVWGQILSFFSRPAYAMAVASCVSLMVCIGLVFDNNNMSDDDKIFAQMQQIPVSDLNSYLIRHRDEFEEHTLLHSVNEKDFVHYFDKPESTLPTIVDQSDEQVMNTDEIVD